MRALAPLALLRVLVLLSLACDAGLRFDFALVIGISFGCAATIAATTEAPPQRRSRRGRIPKRSQRPELDTVPLCLREKASPFWIILLLVSGDPAHPKIKLAATKLPKMAPTYVRFLGQSGHNPCDAKCLLMMLWTAPALRHRSAIGGFGNFGPPRGSPKPRATSVRASR